MKKPDTLNTIFRIPNDEAGTKFWEDLKRYTNKQDYTWRKRGRSAKPGSQHHPAHTPVSQARAFGVYLVSRREIGYSRIVGARSMETTESWKKAYRFSSEEYRKLSFMDIPFEERKKRTEEIESKFWEMIRK